jgi:GH15 family glucan-1,4-alpha-glucosidase
MSKLLTYAPTGGIVAAPTTSLPEQLGGGRNWDYRYTWIRDAARTLDPMLSLGFSEEPRRSGHFLTSCIQSGATNGSGPLQALYGIDGRTHIREAVLDHLEGYSGSAPVRIGNDATCQLQLDIYGEMIDAAYLLYHLTKEIHYEVWSAIAATADWVCTHWDQPDRGIWETHAGRRRFTHSRLMCWVGLDRAIRIAQNQAFPGNLAPWLSARDEIFHRIAGSSRQPIRAGSRRSTLSRRISSPTAWCTAPNRPPRWTAATARRAPFRSAASGTSTPSPAPAATRRRAPRLRRF